MNYKNSLSCKRKNCVLGWRNNAMFNASFSLLFGLLFSISVAWAEPSSTSAPGDPTVKAKAMASAAEFAREGDYARAYCIYAKYAAKNDPEAQYLIGWMYHNGYGLRIDDNKAAAWWKKAGEQGNQDALFALGQVYYHGGRGLSRNITKAVSHFIPAAEQGHDEAKLLLKILLAVNHPSTKPKRKAIIQLLGGQAAEALRVTSKRANIRRAPSTSAGLLKRVNKDTILAEIKVDGEWIQVGIPETGQVGWIFYSLVERAHKRSLSRTILNNDSGSAD